MKLNSKLYRVFRCVVCLVVVCCIIFCSAFQAYATAAGAAGILKASTVTGNPYVIAGAALIALGVWAGAETGAFETMVDGAVSFLDTVGGWIEDGSMQLLKTVDEAGTSAYYVAGDLLETLRSWLFDSGTLISSVLSADAMQSIDLGSGYTASCSVPCTYYYTYTASGSSYTNGCLFWYPSAASSPTINRYKNGVLSSTKVGGSTYSYISEFVSADCIRGTNVTGMSTSEIVSYLTGLENVVSTSSDLSLGYVSNTAIDGDTYDDAYADYMRKQLRVINTGDSGGDNGNNWKWYAPLALAGSLATIATLTQEDEWAGESPEEFPETSTVTEFDIISTPEIDGYQGLEVSPSTGTDTDPGADTDTDTGSGSGSGASTWVPPSDHSQFALADLKNFFPFCIPFDLYDFFQLLNADPVAPVLSWEIQDLSGQTYSLEIDLSEWDSVALLFRRLQLFLFITGLAAASRKFIKW